MMYKVAGDLHVRKRIAKRDYLKRCEMCFDNRMQHIISVDSAKEGQFNSSKQPKKTTKRQP